MIRVVWSAGARRDLAQARLDRLKVHPDWVVFEAADDATRRLAEYPLSGAEDGESGERRLRRRGTPYLARYQVVGDTVRILRVCHEKQDGPRR